ncbi:non-homologous end joining protein Ku [Bradyrhizobium sp. S3.3.6]
MLDLAKPIVDQKSGSLEPDKFEDQYETALVELIDQKRAGKPIVPKERPRGENVVDLMDALRKSIGGAAAETKAAQKPTRRRRQRNQDRKTIRKQLGACCKTYAATAAAALKADCQSVPHRVELRLC